MTQRILEEVTRTSIELLLKEPFYSHLFSAINKEIVFEDSRIQTMAISLRFKTYVLIVNANFWDKTLTDTRQRYGVVKHEILHIIFKHLFVNDKNADRRLLNIAMDLVVNQFIERAQLPKESIFLELFPELDLEKDQTYFYYYEKLRKLQQNIAIDGDLKDSISAANLSSIDSSSHGLDRHDFWHEIFSQSKVEKDILEAQIENLVRIAANKTSSKHFHLLPGSLQLILSNILSPTRELVNWKRVLKLFSESSRKTFVKNTLKRPSKRYGITPGIKIRHKQRLLVAIDTSGSISENEYHDFFSELYHIWKRGAQVHVVECDAKIQKVYDYRGVMPTIIHGGGGTDFNAPIKYSNEIYQPDALVYFTDGYARLPETIPKCPMLWIFSKNGISENDEMFKDLIGRKAKLK